VAPADLGHLPSVAVVEHVGEGVEPSRGAKVVVRVSALVEQLNEVVPGEPASLGDPDEPGLVEYPEGTRRGRHRDPGAEQGRGEEPALDLVDASIPTSRE
jgi:hypothetical protein